MNFENLDFDAPFSVDSDESAPEFPAMSARARATVNRHYARRYFSEQALEKTLPWKFVPGDCFHIISGGDIDAMTYLRFIARQQIITYCAISTWCMARAEVEEIEHLIKTNRIQKIDFYVGEIFKGTYVAVWVDLVTMLQRQGCGRAAIYRNHSKIMCGFGKDFDFLIESSANMNTNPRAENTVITIDSELARLYKDYFDGIKSFDRTFDDWKPHETN
jgi:hypothetical protein